ncbi:MAG: sulfur carrier protein ThiS [Bacteroidales bacterium]|nr:sulfur carrier protein ThiS [Bacteroidales bacterium]
MKLTVNNREEIIDRESLNITELLEEKKFSFKMLVIKVNGQLIKKPEYNSTQLKDGDDVMVLHLISGG